MGEHICSGDASPGGGGGDTFMPLGKSVHDKIGVIPPVDTAMASKLLMRPILYRLGQSVLTRKIRSKLFAPTTDPA